MKNNIILNTVSIVTHFGWRELIKERGYSEATLVQVYKQLFCRYPLIECFRGKIPDEELIAMISAEDMDLGQQAIKILNSRHRIVQQAIRLGKWIRVLDQKGYKVYMISSYPMSKLFGDVKHELEEPLPIYGQIICEYETMSKPSADSYKRLLNIYDLQVDECVLIDDNLDNIKIVNALGIESIIFKGYEETTQEIDALMETL